MSAPTTMFTTQSTSALRAGPARSRATVRAPARARARNPRVTSRDGARSRRDDDDDDDDAHRERED
jgi:hypothetical protein